MLILPEDVDIHDAEEGEDVTGQLVRLDRKLAAKGIDGKWWAQISSKTLREKELDHHWSWRKIVGNRRPPKWDCLAVLGPTKEVEGAITYQVNAISQIETGKGAVYVDRLAVAPRNRDWLIDPNKYTGVGTVLLLAAVRQSYSLKLGGRVWLSCVPDERSKRFYANKNFTFLREDDEGMIDYELPAAEAEKWLVKEGWLDAEEAE